MSRIAIIGAGLAGLACARALAGRGHEVHVHEASDGPGGRVRTDVHEGFLLDRGFQVYLSGYEVAGQMLDLDALELHAFAPGALLRIEGQWHRVHDPFRAEEWDDILQTLRAPIGSLADRARIALLRLSLAGQSPDFQSTANEPTTFDWLRARGFSDTIIQRFFRPFYGGIFLEDALTTSAAMFRFTFGQFARGHATLPARGMGAISGQLAARVPNLHFHDAIHALDGTRLHHMDGRTTEADAVVVATEAPAAARLLPGLTAPEGKAVTCLYFHAPEPPFAEPLIALNADSGPIHNLAVLDRIAPGYSPDGRSLISVTVLGLHPLDSLLPAVAAQLSEWFPGIPFSFLKAYPISHALPVMPAGNHAPEFTPPPGIILAGDHLLHASIEGAIRSGTAAAGKIMCVRPNP